MANRTLGGLAWSTHTPSLDVSLDGETQVEGPMGTVLPSDPEPPRVTEVRTPEADNYAAFTVAVQNTQQNMLIGEDPNRRKALILNTSTTPIIVGKKGRTTLGSGGFVLPQNVMMTYESKQALYANILGQPDSAAPVTPVIVSVMAFRD